MIIHPDILVHWTPRKWAGQPLTNPRRMEYVDHLKSIYTQGLWFTPTSPPETIDGYNTRTVIPPLPIVSFTELRLSQVGTHIMRYGSLGIGFRRSYLLSRGANPVFYVQNASQAIANTNLALIVQYLGKTPALKVLMTYFKPMSSTPGGQLDFYEEMEWRIVAARLGKRDVFKRVGKLIIFDFQPSDVELLVFPDTATRRLAMSDADMQALWGGTYPMMFDAPDISHL